MTGTPIPVRAACYARVSRPDELPILENQLATLRAYVTAHGFEPGGEYVDVASGGSEDRPGFSRLVSDASHPRLRAFDLVVFTSLSRMTRGGISAALDTLRLLERAGVSWHFVEQPTLNFDASTPKLARDIILSVIAAVDEDYRRRISTATKAAFVRRKALAAANGRPLIWGRPRKPAVTSSPTPTRSRIPPPAQTS